MARFVPALAVLALAIGTEAAHVGASKHVGCYYGVWAYTRPGIGEFWPENIDVDLCDVIYYGFGNVLNDTFEVCSWDPWFDMGPADFGEPSIKNCIQERDGDTWDAGCTTSGGLEYCHYDGIRRTLALKEKNPNLKVLFSVGGWTAGGWIFSQMAETRERRTKFIQSAVHFMDYFGLDGIDLDWEFPAFDLLTEEATNPLDREHYTLLMREMRSAFDKHDPPYLITGAFAADPYKASKAYNLAEVHPYMDWFNIMSYDYHGAWDNFTGIDQPLYGKWEESFQGHPMYQFNMHDTVQHYLDEGVPPEKLSLGIHTEGKGWILANPATPETCGPNAEPGAECGGGIYCAASMGTPNMTYSRQEGWMFYYEVLQFYYNSTLPDYEAPPLWPGLIPDINEWTIYDHEHNNQDGCYMAPFAYQGEYWISYDDEYSVDLKVRYANHYNLKGAFVWEVDTDNFQGLFGKERYTILSAINRAVVKGDGLTVDEALGHAWENKGKCAPEAPICDTIPHPSSYPPVSTAGPTCTDDAECNNGNDNVICDAAHSNCNYCDHQCKPGCANDQNCAEGMVCDGEHLCSSDNGAPVVMSITVKTNKCTGCSAGPVEQGLMVHLTGLMSLNECDTDNLDDPATTDYADGSTAVFNGDSGLGGCKGVDLFQKVEGASVMWSGAGSWTPNSQDTVCVDFFGDTNPTCCCSLSRSIDSTDGMVPLSNCHC